MEKVICSVCGNELEVEDSTAKVECKYCGHIEQLIYDQQSLNQALDVVKAIFNNESYMTNPQIVNRIITLAKKAGDENTANKLEAILQALPKRLQQEEDNTVMKIAEGMDVINNHFAELLAGQNKVASATESLQSQRDRLTARAMSINAEIDSVSSVLNIDIFKGRKIDELKKSLVNVEQQIRDVDNKSSDISTGWKRLYYEKLIEIARTQVRNKALKVRLKALESFKTDTGSELALDDPHYLNLAALNNDLGGIIKGSLIQFGTYKNEPLLWRVLAFNNQRVLVISENVIEVGPYHMKNYVAGGYEASDIRKWLNGQLIYDLFNKAEIKSVDTVGDDKLFLLELSQMEFMFKDENDRRATATGYSIGKGVQFSIHDKEMCAGYWLKNINESTMNKFVYTVEPDGSYSKSNGAVNVRTYGIRPAMWLSIIK